MKEEREGGQKKERKGGREKGMEGLSYQPFKNSIQKKVTQD